MVRKKDIVSSELINSNLIFYARECLRGGLSFLFKGQRYDLFLPVENVPAYDCIKDGLMILEERTMGESAITAANIKVDIAQKKTRHETLSDQ